MYLKGIQDFQNQREKQKEVTATEETQSKEFITKVNDTYHHQIESVLEVDHSLEQQGVINHDFEKANLLDYRYASTIAVGEDGTIYVGNKGAIRSYTPDTFEETYVTSDTDKNAFHSDDIDLYINKIIPYKNGIIWINSNGQVQVRTLNKRDGREQWKILDASRNMVWAQDDGSIIYEEYKDRYANDKTNLVRTYLEGDTWIKEPYSRDSIIEKFNGDSHGSVSNIDAIWKLDTKMGQKEMGTTKEIFGKKIRVDQVSVLNSNQMVVFTMDEVYVLKMNDGVWEPTLIPLERNHFFSGSRKCDAKELPGNRIILSSGIRGQVHIIVEKEDGWEVEQKLTEIIEAWPMPDGNLVTLGKEVSTYKGTPK